MLKAKNKKTMSKNKLICGLTETEIETLKEQHKFLILAEIKQGDNVYHAIFKEPTFQTLEATGAIAKNNEVKGTIALYNNCLVKADEAIETRELLKLKAVESVALHMNSFDVSVKNL